MTVKADLEKCTGCGTCVEACPSEALSLKNDKVTVDADACVDCGVCVDECPEKALSMDE